MADTPTERVGPARRALKEASPRTRRPRRIVMWGICIGSLIVVVLALFQWYSAERLGSARARVRPFVRAAEIVRTQVLSLTDSATKSLDSADLERARHELKLAEFSRNDLAFWLRLGVLSQCNTHFGSQMPELSEKQAELVSEAIAVESGALDLAIDAYQIRKLLDVRDLGRVWDQQKLVELLRPLPPALKAEVVESLARTGWPRGN